MNPADPPIVPDWKWGTPEGSRELDRRLDLRLTFREKIQWLKEAETLSLRLQAARESACRAGRPACRVIKTAFALLRLSISSVRNHRATTRQAGRLPYKTEPRWDASF